MRPVALLLAAILIAGTAALAQEAEELELEHSLNSALVTPHTAWAKPYALGPTRVLFFVRGHDTDPREVVELKQRFDLEAQMVMWCRIIDSSNEGWHGGERGVQRMARLLTQKWDAFVFMAPGAGAQAVTPDMLPLEQQLQLFQAVADGAGLVMLGADEPRALKEKNRLPQAPAFLSDVAGATAYSVLKGRALRLPAIPKIDYRPGWDVDFDEWDMRLGKAILWAAGKEPKVSPEITLVTTAQPGPRPQGWTAEIAWGGGTAQAADIALRRDDGTTIRFPARPVKGPSLVLQIPPQRAGSYFLDVIAREGQRVVGFASKSFTVEATRKVDAVALDQDWAELNGKVSGKVTLSGPRAANETLVVSLRDRRARELARQIITPTAAPAAFSFPVPTASPMLLEVRATLMAGKDEVASNWQYARVVKRHHGRFNFIMWDQPRGNLMPWLEQSLADSGVSVQLNYGTPPPTMSAYEIAWIPYTIHLGEGCKPVCWSDEPNVQKFVDEIVQKHVPTAHHGVFVYSLGDEITVRGGCTSDACLAAYRKYLQEQYGDIAALNASWGTSYTSFDQVQLSRPDDHKESEAFRTGNTPRWFDRQAFQSDVFCKLCERFGGGFRSIDPDSHCGFEGAGTFGAADDLDGFVRSNAFWSPYPGTADEVVRSIAPRSLIHSNWMGYTKDADSLLEKYWRMVTRGCDSVWWWRWNGVGRFHGWLSPIGDPYPATQEILRDTQIVRDGLGDLLLQSEMQTDGIGLLYSLPSGYASQVAPSSTFVNYESNHAAFHSALRELGLNFRYFTDRQMRLKEVDLSRFKAIILPMTQAMSAAEASMFREYVRQGGLLIADVRPAIYDGHVKPLAAGQLDDVFGIRRTGAGEAVIAAAQIKVPSAGGKLEALDLPAVRADGGVEAAGATSAGQAGKAPLFLTNQFGKGRAVLLNMAMATYAKLGSDNAPESAARLLRLTLNTVTPALALTDPAGQRVRNVEVTRWMNGPVQIVSIFRHMDKPGQAVVRLPQACYVYDLKARRGLGRKQAFEVTITPCRAQFFALSPQPLKPVTVQLAPNCPRGSVQRVRLAASLAPGQQAVKLQVKLPDGRLADWPERVAVADVKGATVEVPVAFNDPPGRWTVSATDLYSGQVASAQFTVK